MHAAWTVKHKPGSLSEVVGNSTAIEKLSKWVKSWEKGVPKKRAAFLYGPPGVGKTTSVEALANDFGMELVERNASDYRTADAVERFAGLASQYGTLLGRRRLILLDEMDGITGTADRGGVRAVIKIVKEARCPVVLVANNAYNPRFSTLRKYCLLIEFTKPTVLQVVKHLKRVCVQEGIVTDDQVLKFVAARSGRDVRSAVNDLQALAQGRKKLAYEDVSWQAERDRKEAIFKVLTTIFYSGDAWEAKRALDAADVDPDMLFEWIYENVPRHFTDPRDLVRAMEALSLADVYRGRIRFTQNWSLLKYVFDFMTVGVAMAREGSKPGGWIPFRFPERIRTMGQTKGLRAMQSSIGIRIKRRCHISSVRAVREFIPYLRVIFESNAEMSADLARWLDLDETMVEYLAGGKKQASAIGKRLE
ncbi:MAG: replication factor C large subunit [Candidatus Bathyarchaeia archaeon]